MNEWTKWFRARLAEQPGTHDDFALSAGIKLRNVDRYLKGTIPRASTRTRIEKVFGERGPSHTTDEAFTQPIESRLAELESQVAELKAILEHYLPRWALIERASSGALSEEEARVELRQAFEQDWAALAAAARGADALLPPGESADAGQPAPAPRQRRRAAG